MTAVARLEKLCGAKVTVVLTGPETSLHYPPVPATVANNPKPMIKRNGNTGPSNRKSIIFTRVDFFISRNVPETSGEQGMWT